MLPTVSLPSTQSHVLLCGEHTLPRAKEYVMLGLGTQSRNV